MNWFSRSPPRLYFSSWRAGRALFEAGGVVILMYHRIGHAPATARSQALYVSPALFRRQLRGLLAAGLPCLPTLDDALATAHAGGRGFCITFDDGFRSVFTHALPTLTELGLRATQFLVANRLGDTSRWDQDEGEPAEPLMNAAEVRAWLQAGQEIGSHTLTHPRLGQLPTAAARAQLRDSRARLEDAFGRPVRHFCYPYGDYDARARELAAEAGYRTACTTDFGPNGPEADSLTLCRVLARYRFPDWRNLLGRARLALRGPDPVAGMSVPARSSLL